MLKKKRAVLSALFVMFVMPAFAAAPEEKTVQEQQPRGDIKKGKDSYFTLTVENDSLGGGTDQNYTSGVRFTYFDVGSRPKKWAGWLDGVIPTFSINETTSISYSFGQNLYTPSDITIAGPQPGEHPWAAFLYGSVGLSSVTDNHVDDVEATIGVVGPWALGEGTQRFVHKLVGSDEPQGWDNQLENEPGLILSWRRRRPQIFNYKFSGLSFSGEPNVGVTLGNIYTFAESGFTLRLSPYRDRWQDTPPMVRPSMPGNGFFESQEEKFSWYFFTGVQGRAIARNIFLDGNTFEDSYSVDKKHFVMDATAGVATTFGNTRISYTAVYRTKEFETQNDAALFGTVSLGYRF